MFPVFKDAITNKKVRPTFPAETLSSFKELVSRCWDDNPDERPNFSEIIQNLEVIAVDAAIQDEVGRQVWKTEFLGSSQVLFAEFIRALAPHLTTDPLTDDTVKYGCLKALLATKQEDHTLKTPPDVVSLERFGYIISFFSPIKLETTLTTIKEIMKIEGFQGDITTEEAEAKLAAQGKGYLVRLSTTNPGLFTISKVAKTAPHRITHQRVKMDREKKLYIISSSGKSARSGKKSKKPTESHSLPQLIKELGLKQPVPSPYAHLFNKNKAQLPPGGVCYYSEDPDD